MRAASSSPRQPGFGSYSCSCWGNDGELTGLSPQSDPTASGATMASLGVRACDGSVPTMSPGAPAAARWSAVHRLRTARQATRGTAAGGGKSGVRSRACLRLMLDAPTCFRLDLADAFTRHTEGVTDRAQGPPVQPPAQHPHHALLVRAQPRIQLGDELRQESAPLVTHLARTALDHGPGSGRNRTCGASSCGRWVHSHSLDSSRWQAALGGWWHSGQSSSMRSSNSAGIVTLAAICTTPPGGMTSAPCRCQRHGRHQRHSGHT
jgi:hypothetical protein